MSRYFWLLLVAVAALVSSATIAKASDPIAKVPPGFENLDRSRSLMLDLHYRGQNLGAVQVVVSGRTFHFHVPIEVQRLLTLDLSNGDVDLSRDFRTNFDRVCSRLSSKECGQIEASDISFIVDEEKFRIDAFVSEKFRGDTAAREFLQPSYAGASVTSVLDGTIAGVNGKADYYLQSETVAAMGRARAIAVGAVSSVDSFLAREALFELDHSSLRSKVGLFWAPTNDFLGRRRMVGIGTQSQTDTLAIREQKKGTPLEVALPERSRVDVFENGRLLWTGFLPAGFGSIDTRNFPEGAYPVTLQITGASGAVREEPRFFVKDASLPAIGKSQLFGFIGVLGETTQSGTSFRELLLTAGYKKRLSNRVALGGTIVATDQTALAEVNLDFADERFRSRSSVLIGESGQIGIGSNFSLRATQGTSISLSAKKLWSNGEGPLLPTENYDQSLPFPRPGYLQLSGSYTQIIASISQRVSRGNLRLHALYTDTPETKPVYAVGPVFEYPLMSGAAGNLQFSASALQTNDAFTSFVGVRLLKILGESVLSGRAGFAHDSQNRNRSDMHASDVIGDLAVSSRKSIGQYDLTGSAGLSREFYGHDARAEVEASSSYLSARASVLQNLNGADGQTQYAASFRTAIGASKNKVIMTGENFTRSAINISLDAPESSEFEISVDGRVVGRLHGQEDFALFLEPYSEYDVSLRNVGRQQFFMEKPRRSVTLFPGSVETLSFVAAPQFTVFGRLLNRDGEAIANEVVRSQHGIGQSDSNGFFQLDVTEDDTVSVGKDGNLHCPISHFATEIADSFQKVGDLTCN